MAWGEAAKAKAWGLAAVLLAFLRFPHVVQIHGADIKHRLDECHYSSADEPTRVSQVAADLAVEMAAFTLI